MSHQHYNRQHHTEKTAALKWLKNHKVFNEESSFSIPLPASQEVINGFINLSKSRAGKRVGLNIQISEEAHKITFTGESTLMYFAEKGVKFPHCEEYMSRIALGHDLVKAADKNDLQEVSRLLEAGAYPNILDTTKDSALHHAARNDNVAIAELLLKAGANPNIGNDHFDTPLHYAVDRLDVEKPDTKMLELLCAHGADPDRKNDNNSSPLDEARERGKKSAEFLLKRTIEEKNTARSGR